MASCGTCCQCTPMLAMFVNCHLDYHQMQQRSSSNANRRHAITCLLGYNYASAGINKIQGEMGH
eukprot:scaffold274201_cov15-Prasinocladus_malaysianus.AAC.1